MSPDDVYVPAETPKLRWRDQWADHIHEMGGPFVAYPLWLTALVSLPLVLNEIFAFLIHR